MNLQIKTSYSYVKVSTQTCAQSKTLYISANFCIVKMANLKPWSFVQGCTFPLSITFLCIYPSQKEKHGEVESRKIISFRPFFCLKERM